MGAHLRRTGVDLLSLWTVDSTGWPAVQFFISFGFFLVEVVASRVTGSLLLLSSAFQTLGGALALAVAWADIWMASGRCLSRKNTFGGARVRIMGTLVSAVFQSALYLAIIPEAVLRIAAPQIIEHALALMGIGAMGVLIHLARAWLTERQSQDIGPRPCCSRRITQVDGCAQEMEDLLGNGSSTNGWPWVAELSPIAKKSGPFGLDLMMACLGPVAVFLYSVTYYLLVEMTPCVDRTACLSHCPTCSPWSASESLQQTQLPCWLLYLDPGIAIAVAVTLLRCAWPALYGGSLVLLQAVPDQLDLPLLEQHLRAAEGVAAVRDLSVWQLDGPTSLVATAHVCCLDVTKYETVISNVQKVFCEHGIHATTVQPHLGTCANGAWHEQCEVTSCKKGLSSSPAEVTEYETTV